MNGYKTDWRDFLRHIANFCFIGSYLCLSNAMLVAGSLFTLVGETMLAPSAFKHKSWSTILVAGVFLTLALSTLYRELL
jgi:hypothetical protein